MASITIDEAARYLGVTTRTISNYIAQGIISYHKKQGSNRKYLSTEDIQDLLEAKNEATFSIKKFKELQARVKKLEANVEVLMRILDTKQIPLGLSASESEELYNAAVDSNNSVLTEQHIEAWLPILMRLDENDLKNIEDTTKVKDPWSPFISLCLALIVYTTSNKNYQVSLPLQSYHRELVEARRRLRLSALIYIESRGASIQVDSLSIKHPDTTIESVKKILKSRHK